MHRTTSLALCALFSLAGLALFASARAPAQAGPWKQSELEALSKRLQKDVETLRGETFRRDVSVKVATKADLVEYMKRRLQEEEPPEKLAADELVSKLLGLFPHDRDLIADTFALLESQVGGFYDPPSDTFWLMEGMPRGFAAPILAHELIHALDDQLFDIDGQMRERKDDGDALQAYRFVVEGSGTAGGNRWTIEHMDEIDMSGLQDMMDEQQASLLSAPPYLWKPLLGAYLQGAAFLARADSMLAGQMAELVPADVSAAFRDLPLSTEQVLHPAKYWDPAQRDDPRPVTYALGELPEGWSVRREDTFGELGLAQVADAGRGETLDLSNPTALLSISFTHPTAEGWGGDRMILLGDGTGAWLRLVSVWDSERDAGEHYAMLLYQSKLFEAAATALGGKESGVEIAYGASPDEVVLTIWSGVERRDRRKLERAVQHTTQSR
jgi:hypothetical protein